MVNHRECKNISEQILGDNIPLRQDAIAYSKELSKKWDKSEKSEEESKNSAAMLMNSIFGSAYYLFNLSKYKFVTVSTDTITIYDTTNPHQIMVDKRLPTSLSRDESYKMTGQYTCPYGGMKPWYFQVAIFPDKHHMIVMFEGNSFHFINLESGESFSAKTKVSYGQIQVINNKQIMLIQTDIFSRRHESHIMIVDLKRKRVKIDEEKPFIPSESETTLPLSSHLIARSKDRKFICCDISADGKKFEPNKFLSGTATFHAYLDTGEIVFWDKNTNHLNLLDPHSKQIIPLQEIRNVTGILICDREILVMTPTQWLWCEVPNSHKDLINGTDKQLATYFPGTPGVRNLIFDYLNLDGKDNPSLLTQHSFLRVKRSENIVNLEKLDAARPESPSP